MRVKCPHCDQAYRIKDALISPRGIRVRCPSCHDIFPIRADNADDFAQKDSLETTGNTAPETAPGEYSHTSPKTEEELAAADIEDELQMREPTNVQSDGVLETNSQSEEISLADEISEIDFDADPDISHTVKRPKQALPTTERKPKPKVDVQTEKTPTAKRLFSNDTPLQSIDMGVSVTKKTLLFGSAKKVLYICVVAVLTIAIAGYVLFVRHKRTLEKQEVVENSKKTTQKQPVRKQKKQQALEINLTKQYAKYWAAMNLFTAPSIEFACNQLYAEYERAQQPKQSKIFGFYSYCIVSNYAHTKNSNNQQKALQVASRILLDDSKSFYGMFAALLFFTLEKQQQDSKAYSRLEKMTDNSSKKQALLHYIQAVYAHNKGDFDAAQISISKSLSADVSIALPLHFAEKELYKNSAEKTHYKDLISENQKNIIATYPEFRQFIDKKSANTVSQKKAGKRTKKRKIKTPKKTNKTAKKLSERETAQHSYLSLVKQGDLQFNKGQYKNALSSYSIAVKYPEAKKSLLHTKIGFVWLKLYRIDEAYDNFERAIEINANYADAHKGLATVYDHLGDLEKAAREYRLYLQLKPSAEDAGKIRKLLEKMK